MKEVTDQAEFRKENKLAELLIGYCELRFPYVCTGKKSVSDDGLDVRCECGFRVKV